MNETFSRPLRLKLLGRGAQGIATSGNEGGLVVHQQSIGVIRPTMASGARAIADGMADRRLALAQLRKALEPGLFPQGIAETQMKPA